jgi:hypothetical protein
MHEQIPVFKLGGQLGEVSALLRCGSESLRSYYRFDRAFWALKEQGPVDEALLLIGHRRHREPFEAWTVKAVRARLSVARETEDAAALARQGDWIYLLGSQGGGPDGALRPERTVVARFAESSVRAPLASTRVELQAANRPFMIHRAVNDALRRSGLGLIPLASHAAASFVLPTLEDGYAARAAWAPRLQADDYPLRVDGLVFLADGSALLGLRFPMTSSGDPLLIRIDDMARCFSDNAALTASVAGRLLGAGAPGQPAGVLAIQPAAAGAGRERLDVLTGPLGLPDSRDALANEYPGSASLPCRLWRVELPRQRMAGAALQAELVREFEERAVESLAEDPPGHWHYTISGGGETFLAIAERPLGNFRHALP